MAYTLYNKSKKANLVHPKVGLWFTLDINEAKDMLEACYQYLDSMKLDWIKKDIVIIDVKTKEEIK